MMFFMYVLASAPLFCGAQGQQAAKSQVTLSLNEFQDLFSSARLEDAERRLVDQRKMDEAEHKKRLSQMDSQKSKMEAQARKEWESIFPLNFQVLRQTALGEFNASAPTAGVERDVASFDLELTLRVMESKWTLVPIANTTSTVASDFKVAWANGDNRGADEEFRPIDPVSCPDVMLMMREEQQVLATNRTGLFRIKFKVHTRVGKARNLNKMGMSSLLYPISEFFLRIADAGIDSDSSSVADFSVQPNSAILEVQPSDGYTDIKAMLPLNAESIQIRWLDVVDDAHGAKPISEQGTAATDHKLKEDSSPQVTATHEVLHSVGEGTLRSSHILEFTTTSEMSALNSVQFVVHGEGVRITSVEGHALQSWEIEESGISSSSKVIRATFKSSHLDSTVSLLVHTEIDHRTGASADQVEVPRIECRNVLRQIGHVAVIKNANVEVHEHAIMGVTHCEPTEISSQLRLNIDRPIVLSYKYLNPQNSVVLHVKEHVAMDTLEAAVDRLHYKALVTETHTVHSLVLLIQSTKLQYLELLGLPSTASMFTATVNSVPAKPVEGEGEGNSILVPLLIGLDPEAANEGGSMLTSVEVTYFSRHDSLGQNGTLQLAPPRLTVPISVLTVHLRLPTDFEYNFSGDFGRPAAKLAYPIPSAFNYKTGKRVVKEDYEFSVIDDVWPEDKKLHTKAGGVNIVTPNTGRSFHFQRLLVVDNLLSLNTTFSEPSAEKRSWWSKVFG